MKKTALAILATLLVAAQAPAAPADLARELPAAAKKGDIAAPIAKAFDAAFAAAKDSKAVKDALFQNASAVGAVLPSLDGAQAKAAVAAVMKAAEAAAKTINGLDKLEGDAAADNLGKCYAIAAAALANVLPPDFESRDLASFLRECVPEAYADQVAAAFANPADALGAAKASDGKALAASLSGKDGGSPSLPGTELVESLSITSSTTTTTTTTTTSTTQIVISIDGKLVDPVTLEPIVTPTTTKVVRPPVIVPPPRHSPTPVGRR